MRKGQSKSNTSRVGTGCEPIFQADKDLRESLKEGGQEVIWVSALSV